MHNNIHNLRQRHLLKELKTPYTSWWHHRLSWGCRQTNSNIFYFFHKKCPKHFTYLQRGGQGRTSNRIEKSINCWKKGCRGIIILCNDLREIILPCSSHSSLVVWKTLPHKLKWNLHLRYRSKQNWTISTAHLGPQKGKETQSHSQMTRSYIPQKILPPWMT